MVQVVQILRKNRLSWYGHVMRREETHLMKKAMDMNVEGLQKRGKPTKIWMECVRSDMKEKGVHKRMTANRFMEDENVLYRADPE